MPVAPIVSASRVSSCTCRSWSALNDATFCLNSTLRLAIVVVAAIASCSSNSRSSTSEVKLNSFDHRYHEILQTCIYVVCRFSLSGIWRNKRMVQRDDCCVSRLNDLIRTAPDVRNGPQDEHP